MLTRTAAVFAILALPAAAQDFPATPLTGICHEQPDRWGIRAPTPEEEAEHGRGILVFEYWNSVHRCSKNTRQGVYFQSPTHGELRFEMTVEVDAQGMGGMERITLDPQVAPFAVYGPPLVMGDGEEPGVIILYPQMF